MHKKRITFLTRREVTIAEDIPNQDAISIRQELFSDSLWNIDQIDYYVYYQVYNHSSNLKSDSQISEKEKTFNVEQVRANKWRVRIFIKKYLNG